MLIFCKISDMTSQGVDDVTAQVGFAIDADAHRALSAR
jgi:hypothetical protein